jgi:hypothetical protein
VAAFTSGTAAFFHSQPKQRFLAPLSASLMESRDERVTFKARERHMQVACNVQIDRHWERFDHFHSQ